MEEEDHGWNSGFCKRGLVWWHRRMRALRHELLSGTYKLIMAKKTEIKLAKTYKSSLVNEEKLKSYLFAKKKLLPDTKL
jgi:hypothetical protein